MFIQFLQLPPLLFLPYLLNLLLRWDLYLYIVLVLQVLLQKRLPFLHLFLQILQMLIFFHADPPAKFSTTLACSVSPVLLRPQLCR